MESDVSHDVEARLRNIESHLGIGSTDEETGEYTVQQHEAPAETPSTVTEPEPEV